MYVVEHPLRDLVLREDPLKVLYLGISPDGLPLEVVGQILVVVATPEV